MNARLLPGRCALWCAMGCALFFALRLGLGTSSGASLHVDEAQYWDWSRQLQWGYFSKPPLIAGLIAAATSLLGDSETALRCAVIACYPLTALVLFSLGRAMVVQGTGTGTGISDQQAGNSLGIRAAWIFLASPIAALLGLVATTDGPLLLAWAVALAALWQAVVGARAGAWWVFALAVGIGLLGKYTMLALLPGAALFVWRHGAPKAGQHLLAASAGSLLLLAPNLGWNMAEGWPTLRHTLDITVASAQPGSAWGWTAARLQSQFAHWAAFVVAQPLLLAPLVLPALWLARRSNGPVATPLVHPASRAFLVCTSLPLVLIGLAQAATGPAQVNWVLPVHLAGTLALAAAWTKVQNEVFARRLLVWALALQVVVLSLLAWWPGQRNSLLAAPHWLRPLDPWHRMRGWQEALAELAPIARQQRPDLVIATTRGLMAQTAYHWRGQGLPRVAWQAGNRPANHYEMVCPWHPPTPGQASAGRVLVLSEGAPPPALVALLGPLQLVARSSAGATTGRALGLQLLQPIHTPMLPSRWMPTRACP